MLGFDSLNVIVSNQTVSFMLMMARCKVKWMFTDPCDLSTCHDKVFDWYDMDVIYLKKIFHNTYHLKYFTYFRFISPTSAGPLTPSNLGTLRMLLTMHIGFGFLMEVETFNPQASAAWDYIKNVFV